MLNRFLMLFLLVTTSVQAQDMLSACAASRTKINIDIYRESSRRPIDDGPLGDILARTQANFTGIRNVTIYYAVRGTRPKPLDQVTVIYYSLKAKRCADVMGKVLAQNLYDVYSPESREFRNGVIVRPWPRGYEGPNMIQVLVP